MSADDQQERPRTRRTSGWQIAFCIVVPVVFTFLVNFALPGWGMYCFVPIFLGTVVVSNRLWKSVDGRFSESSETIRQAPGKQAKI